MNYSITQNGKPLDKSKYTIDKEAKTFSTTEDDLVLDFRGVHSWTFKTGYGCTFNTGLGCTFKTGYDCVVVRRDVYEVIELSSDKVIKLNGCGERGYTVVEEELDDVTEEAMMLLKERGYRIIKEDKDE